MYVKFFREYPTFLNNGVNPILKMGGTKSYPVVLPQNDEEKESRRKKLQKARSKYQLEQKTFQLTGPQQQLVNIVNVPPMVSLHIQYSSYAH